HKLSTPSSLVRFAWQGNRSAAQDLNAAVAVTHDEKIEPHYYGGDSPRRRLRAGLLCAHSAWSAKIHPIFLEMKAFWSSARLSGWVSDARVLKSSRLGSQSFCRSRAVRRPSSSRWPSFSASSWPRQFGAALQCREACVQRFGGQAVQQQAVTGSQRGERHQGMLVAHHIHSGGVADDSRGIDRYGLIQLQRITGAPEVAIRQEQLIERRVYLDRRFEVENIEAPFRQGVYVDIKWAISHCGEVE